MCIYIYIYIYCDACDASSVCFGLPCAGIPKSVRICIVAIFYPFSQFCEINLSLLSLQTQPNTAPNLFQRGVEYGKYDLCLDLNSLWSCPGFTITSTTYVSINHTMLVIVCLRHVVICLFQVKSEM